METVETPFHNDPLDYEISCNDGVHQAVNPVQTVMVLPDGPGDIHKVRAIRGVGTDDVQFDTCLKASLNGVNVYIQDGAIVITTQELKL